MTADGPSRGAALRRRRGAFLDRDGTIIRDANYLRDPDGVELLPGAAAAVARLNAAGIRVIIVTNQSGIARELINTGEYEEVRRRLGTMLASEGAHVDATYMCPHHPDVAGACDCRKPGLALYRQAIAEHDIDPAQSLFVGDRWRDVVPSATLGGFGILLDVDSTPSEDRETARRTGAATATSLAEAVERFLAALPADSGHA